MTFSRNCAYLYKSAFPPLPASRFSIGEKQKLGFARVLYHRPSFAVLDEATSSLDAAAEARLYSLLKGGDESSGAGAAATTTLLSVAHRDSLRRFHSVELSLKGNGEWTLEPVTL